MGMKELETEIKKLDLSDSAVLESLNSVLNPCGYIIMESWQLYEWQKCPRTQPHFKQSELPEGAKEYLQLTNPRLQDLQARYAVFNDEVTAPLVWTDAHVRPDDILYFRGDNAYVWQLRGPNMNILSYALTTFYVKSIDRFRLLELLEEDEFFGNFTFRFDNRLISRDLLDSIIEIYFLEKHLSLSTSKDMTILDIGAGYGRLAHRTLRALPNIHNYLCTDAVAISSFISNYYLRFRNLEGKAKVVPLDEIQSALRNGSVNIAVNIHSFSECRIAAIDWWLSLLEKSGVKYLMIVPNAGNHGGRLLQTNDGKDFGEVIEKHGYRLMAKEPKYRDPVAQEYAINPTHHYLFELQ
jgi:hypothetical protein